MAGYSSKPLLTKLGYKPDDSVYVVNAPAWFKTELGKNNVVALPVMPATWAHGFFTKKADLQAFLTSTKLDDFEKGFWLSWPKKASKMPSDISEQDLRDLLLPTGWVDTKVAAVDDTWSGLKFVRRKN